MTYMQKLLRFAKRHNVAMKHVSDAEYQRCQEDIDFSDAPFTDGMGVYWRSKILVYTDQTKWYELVHDLGHLLASNDTPDQSTEYDFLGWEMRLTMTLDATKGLKDWRDGNNAYMVELDDTGLIEIGDLSDQQFKRLVDDRIAAAKATGLIRNNRVIVLR